MKEFKMKTTRPEFLLALMGGNQYTMSDKEMKKNLHDSNHLCYCVYTVLMDADVAKDDIIAANNDGEAIAITFRSKSEAKRVRELCHKETVRYGSHLYKVKMKVRDRHLIATTEQIDEDKDEVEEE